MSTTTKSSVALLGLGSMGIAVANALLNSGFVLHAWNRTKDRSGIQDLIDRGGKFHARANGAVEAADIVIINVLDYSTISQILKAEELDIKFKVIVNLTNGTPNESRRMEQHFHDTLGAKAYFDGSIMTTPGLLATDASFIYLSGEIESALQTEFNGTTVQRVLKAIGRIDYVGPDAGAASLYDLAFLAAMYGMFGGTIMSIGLLAKRSSESRTSIADVIATNLVPGLQALLPSLTRIAQQTEQQDYGAHGHPNSMQLHGLQAIIQTCNDEGVPAEPLLFLRQMFDEVEREGGGAGGMGLVGRKFWPLQN